MTATERYKMLLANALERVCVLEAELEAKVLELESLRESQGEGNGAHAEHHIAAD